MKKHADFIRPKFEVVLSVFEKEPAGLGVTANMSTEPRGGYIVITSFDSNS